MTITDATALTTAAIAVLVAIITGGQWVTNRHRLRHELFDRRYALFEQIAGFIAQIMLSGNVPDGEPEGFRRRTSRAYFVFACDDDIKTLVLETYEKAVELHALEVTLGPSIGDERKGNIEAQRAVKEWFGKTLGSLEGRFQKYLRLID